MSASQKDAYARVVVYAIFLGVLFGCAGNNSTPATSSSSKPNASSSTISVVDSGGSRLEEATVTLSTALSGNSASGTIIGSQTTGFTGQATFNGIPASGQICASASSVGYTPAAVCRQPFPSALTLRL